MSLRVLHIGKFYPPHQGGMEVFLADLVNAQRDAGIDAAVLVHGTPDAQDPPWLIRVPMQWQLIYAPIALGFRSALAKAISRYKPHVLHLHMPNNSAFWALTLPAARELPWIVHWHSDVVVSQIRPALAWAYRLYRPFEQAVLQHASRIIATSPPYLDASEPLQRWRDKCTVVPLGVGTPPPHEAAPPIHWRSGALRLLSVGRLTYYKGFETLITAVAGLNNVELLIAGDGELRGPLQQLIEKLTPAGQAPNVRLLGSVKEEEKNALFQSCDVFCLASRERTEAFGMVILEAMRNARPCIVSALPGSGMPWLVTEAGAGIQAPVSNVPAWREAILKFQNDEALRTRCGQAGQRALHARFSINLCAQRLYSQYRIAAPDAHLKLLPRPPLRSTLIVIPAQNEAATIGEVIQRLKAAGWSDILVIDDQSTDDTGAIARANGACVLRPTLPVGAWGGMQTGIRFALRNGYLRVVTMDADGQHEVDEIPALFNAAATNEADLVVGAFPERASRLRHIAWHWFRKLAGFDLRDLTSGFRLYNRSAMSVLASREATLLDYQDLGALLLIRRAGLSIAEVPTPMKLRSIGKSRIFNSWFSVVKYMFATTLLCLARWQFHSEKKPTVYANPR